MGNNLPGRTYFFFLAQSINLTCAVMSVTMAAIVGATLAPDESLSTLPYGMQFLALMVTTYPAAKLMAVLGRRRSFFVGALPLVLAGVTGFVAVENKSFALLLLSHSALGAYVAFANFNRFAASDGLETTLKARAISLVVAGGIIAAFLGPALVKQLRNVQGYELFALCYASFVVLGLLAMIIALMVPLSKSSLLASDSGEHVAGIEPSKTSSAIWIAAAVAAVGYAIMNLLMVQSSIHLDHSGAAFSDIGTAIQWHVVAMFAPSFLTGRMIRAFGVLPVIRSGLLLIGICCVVNMMYPGYAALVCSLVLLGLGWNLTYVGGGALLVQYLGDRPNAVRIQGKNDVLIAVLATIGAFSPSFLLALIGWGGSNVLCLVLSMSLLIAVHIGSKQFPDMRSAVP